MLKLHIGIATFFFTAKTIKLIKTCEAKKKHYIPIMIYTNKKNKNLEKTIPKFDQLLGAEFNLYFGDTRMFTTNIREQEIKFTTAKNLNKIWNGKNNIFEIFIPDDAMINTNNQEIFITDKYIIGMMLDYNINKDKQILDNLFGGINPDKISCAQLIDLYYSKQKYNMPLPEFGIWNMSYALCRNNKNINTSG